jgi:hypothetical protein
MRLGSIFTGLCLASSISTWIGIVQNNLYTGYLFNLLRFAVDATCTYRNCASSLPNETNAKKNGFPLFSSLLKVELHDGKTEQECKGQDPGDVHNRDHPQEVMVEAKVIRDKRCHRLHLLCSLIDLNILLDVTKLRGNQPVERPGNRADPAVPPPPNRHSLKERSICMSHKNLVPPLYSKINVNVNLQF